jgi:threonine synthase
MLYYSSQNSQNLVDFRTALMTGLASDKGLYIPCKIPQFSMDFWKDKNFQAPWELASEMLFPYVADVFTPIQFTDLLQNCLSFDFPLHALGDAWVLELFHGPTCAFKDIGSRFLAHCMSHLSDQRMTILVATSGDTGSAVAQGFYKMSNVDVVILYPKGRISPVQEKQLTTVGANVTALEVEGSFDQCQQMVKQAFLDSSLQRIRTLNSANSINIARWIPQSIYYAWSVHQLESKLCFTVPSGNYGNVSAGILAMQMGMPCGPWAAASNTNNIVPQYLQTAQFNPRPSVRTLSNAMDVGNPSNFIRLLKLFEVCGQDWEEMIKYMRGYCVSDEDTLSGIKQAYEQYNYIIDPHTAVAYQAMHSHQHYMRSSTKNFEEFSHVILATASPAKFSEVVHQAIHTQIKLPKRLQKVMHRTEHKVTISAVYQDLKSYLIDTKVN